MQTFGPGVPVSPEYIEQHLDEHIEAHQAGRMFPWSLVLKGNNEKVGFGYLRWADKEAHTLSIGYLIRKVYWGNGYATEFAKAAVKFGIVELNPYQIVATVIPDHIASRRVLEKVDFRTVITFLNGIETFTLPRTRPVQTNRIQAESSEIERTCQPAVHRCLSISEVLLSTHRRSEAR